MRILHCAAAVSVLLACLAAESRAADSSQGAFVPVFSNESFLSWSGGTIHTDNYGAIPCAADWNGDGKKDLLVGVYYNGNIWIYLNEGTNENPQFSSRTMLQADGSNIALSYG